MKKHCTLTKIALASTLLAALAGCATTPGGESFSAEDEFKAALTEHLHQSGDLSELRASAEAALAGASPSKQVSLWSLDRALAHNDASSPSRLALETAHQVLSDIAPDVSYHDDTWIRLRPVLLAMLETINSESHQ